MDVILKCHRCVSKMIHCSTFLSATNFGLSDHRSMLRTLTQKLAVTVRDSVLVKSGSSENHPEINPDNLEWAICDSAKPCECYERARCHFSPVTRCTRLSGVYEAIGAPVKVK